MSLLFLPHQISTQVHSKESNLQKMKLGIDGLNSDLTCFLFLLHKMLTSDSFLGQLAPSGCGGKKGLLRKAAEEGFMPSSEPESTQVHSKVRPHSTSFKHLLKSQNSVVCF